MSNNNHREILFRGFHPCEDGGTTIYVEGEAVKGRWVEGSYVFYNHCPHHSIYFNVDVGGDGYIEPKYALECVEVIPSTVGQYTGLTDNNNVKIFEQDIVAIISESDDEQFTVSYNKDNATFELEANTFVVSFDNYLRYEFEIIGNIHDNPELLEVNNDR